MSVASSAPSASLREILQLIDECHVVLKADPSCLHTRAVRGHACMKAKLWDLAIRDFSEILRCRPEDVHGRFSRGMALFQSGRVDDAHRDFSRVLELNPHHVMARYARAGCFNFEGEFQQAIQEYVLALQHDENESAAGFRADKRRLGMHESAEQLIRQAMGTSSTRLRTVSLPPGVLLAREQRTHPRSPCLEQQQSLADTQTVSKPRSKPRKVVQVRVSLSDLTAATPPVPRVERAEESKTSVTSQQQSKSEPCKPQLPAVPALPRAVRKVTVAL